VLVLLLGLLLVAAVGNAQITLQVGGGFGLTSPAADYGGSTIEYYNGTKYGMASGWNLHARARAGLVGFVFAGEVDYSSLSNTGNSEPGKGSVEVAHTILSLRIGPEYHLSIPLSPIQPYLGANFGIHIINGKTTFQGVSKVPSGTFDLSSATRVGLGGTAGVVLKIGLMTKLDLSAQYNLVNLMGRLWEDVDTLHDERLDSYRSLNDERDPLYSPGNDKHFINSDRSIHTIQLKATLMVGL
jgi:outer membrane protein W